MGEEEMLFILLVGGNRTEEIYVSIDSILDVPVSNLGRDTTYFD
jgi:hypothetical protein